MDAVDALVEEEVGPRGGGSAVEGSDLTGSTSDELQAECGADEAQAAGDDESGAVDAFVFGEVHDLFWDDGFT